MAFPRRKANTKCKRCLTGFDIYVPKVERLFVDATDGRIFASAAILCNFAKLVQHSFI